MMTRTNKQSKYLKPSQGFTLMETLVALIIISVGILGFAMLQVESLKTAKTATERSKAIQFAGDMMDRVRTNKSVLTNYSTGGVVASPGAKPKECSDLTANATAQTVCSPTEMAQYEIWQWRTAIEDGRSGFGDGIGKGGIQITGTNPAVVEITVEWSEKGEEKTFSLRSQI